MTSLLGNGRLDSADDGKKGSSEPADVARDGELGRSKGEGLELKDTDQLESRCLKRDGRRRTEVGEFEERDKSRGPALSTWEDIAGDDGSSCLGVGKFSPWTAFFKCIDGLDEVGRKYAGVGGREGRLDARDGIGLESKFCDDRISCFLWEALPSMASRSLEEAGVGGGSTAV